MRVRSLLVAVSFLSVAAPADAVTPMAVAVSGSGYTLSEVTVTQGGSLTLVGADPVDVHDLVAGDRRNGAPLFASGTVGPGGVSGVSGVSSLAPGRYPFYCRFHEWMAGNLTVLATR